MAPIKMVPEKRSIALLEELGSQHRVEPKRARSTNPFPPSQSSQKTAMSQVLPSKFEKDLVQMSEEVSQTNYSIKDQQWGRPPLEKFDPKTSDISFQQLDAEESIHRGVPSVRFFGVTMEGHSVLCNVVGFHHYFYVPAPASFRKEDIYGLTSKLRQFHASLDCIEICYKESIWGYNNNEKSPFIKVILNNAKDVNKLRSAFEKGEVDYNGMFPGGITYDNIPFLLRFMVDCGVNGMSWITLPAKKYTQLLEDEKISSCQIEVTVNYQDIVAHGVDGEWSKIAPLRILSFDIECAGRKGIFPEADKDPVIQIANVVSRYGESRPFVRNVFTVNTCSPIVGSQIFDYQDERDMLRNWKNFVNKVDPDVIIGYNTINFDTPYLLDRAKALKVEDFPFFGRLVHVKQQITDSVFSSKAYGTRNSKVINIDGRMQIDLLQVIQRDYKLRSYTLNSVSAHFLNEQKEDVQHSIITDLQNGNAESRRRLAVYCLKDAYLPMRLLDKLMCIVNYTEMARVTGVPFSFLLSRGQQIKVISQLFRKAVEIGLVIPNLSRSGQSDEQYEGATVIEPIRGYYDKPIATLDFSSLYPSIMMAHNLCYTTLLSKNTIDRLSLKADKDYTIAPTGDCFVKPDLRKGVLPIILEELIGARKKAKADLKKETDPFKKNVLNGRQLALKISANSVYGFTGATIGKLPCLEISSSVTAFGRKMIEKTKNEVESHYSIANGYNYDSQVIYGDTDSVMVKFGPEDLQKCMELGKEAADLVSDKFINPIKLEFEKVYFPYLLINKKRYAGLYWTKTDKFDKMDTKGLETVRRDNCRMVSEVTDTVLKQILIDRNVEEAQNYVKKTISDLLQNKIDLSMLVITKALSRKDYAAKQAHVELAERMRKRDAGSAPALGDRVAYVIINKGSGARNYERSEDPIYVLDNNLPIDTRYYLDNQLTKPLMRIFEPILGERKAKELLTGEHTRTINVASVKSGGLLRFTKKTETCKGCRTPLKPGNKGALCSNCLPRATELYETELVKMSQLEKKFAKLWTQCQRCQGSLHQDVLCSNKDCPIFYMRKKVQKDLSDCGHELQRFDDTDW